MSQWLCISSKFFCCLIASDLNQKTPSCAIGLVIFSILGFLFAWSCRNSWNSPVSSSVPYHVVCFSCVRSSSFSSSSSSVVFCCTQFLDILSLSLHPSWFSAAHLRVQHSNYYLPYHVAFEGCCWFTCHFAFNNFMQNFIVSQKVTNALMFPLQNRVQYLPVFIYFCENFVISNLIKPGDEAGRLPKKTHV